MGISLKGKKILITGSTDGLGKALAYEFAKQGANVIVHGRDKQKIENVLKELLKIYPSGNFQSVLCDFNRCEKIEESFKAIQSLDILINNAGVWYEGSTAEMEVKDVVEMVNINLLSALLITRVFLPIIKQSEFGQILNVSSVAGVEIPAGYFHTVYSSTKFGLQAFTEALAKEHDNTNIRVLGYYPGGMATDLFKKSGQKADVNQPWMFDVQESVEAIMFMLTRSKKISVKRMDLINFALEVPIK